MCHIILLSDCIQDVDQQNFFTHQCDGTYSLEVTICKQGLVYAFCVFDLFTLVTDTITMSTTTNGAHEPF